MKRSLLLTACLVLLSSGVLGQKGGGRALTFVDVPQVSRLVGSGGLHTVGGEPSPLMTFHNPAMTVDTVPDKKLWLSVSPIGAGMVRASAAYSWRVDNVATFTGGVLWSGYGSFDRMDVYGDNQGTFHANDWGIYLTAARRLAPWLTMGATFKPLFSKYDDQSMAALAIDYGADFGWKQGRLTAAFTLRNCGGVIKRPYSISHRDPLPFSMAIALSYRPLKAPFRFYLTLRDLTQWKLNMHEYGKLNGGDNFLRHLLIGVELCPVKVFHANFGYDHRQRREATASEAGGMAGFSWGVGLRISRFAIDYAHSRYHIAGSLNSINIGVDLRKGAFPKRVKKPKSNVLDQPEA